MKHEAPAWVELFSDDFSTYPVCERMDEIAGRDDVGPSRQTIVDKELSSSGDPRQSIGPWRQTTLHYSWKSARTGGWRNCPLPWRIVDVGGRHLLDQPESFFNVVLKAGDPNWRNYVLEVELSVADGPAGPIVRYHTSRRNYWIAFQAGQPVKLIRRDQDDHVVLGMTPDWITQADKLYRCRVTCDGSHILVAVDGKEVISVEDDRYPCGEIGLRTEGPSRFTSVKVLAEADEAEALEARRRKLQTRRRRLAQRAPKPKLIHSVRIPITSSYLHLQDVNDDGRAEIVAIEAQVMQFDYIRLARMSVFDWDGKLLWQLGEPRESKYAVHGDIAFNVADVDGDGRTEILLTRDFEILILDGATGKIKKRTPTPRAFKGAEDFYERAVGDSILVCNLRGLEAPRDFVLKDRYRNLWAYTCDLQPLWHRALNTGHYPRARDINGDGKDEIMAGYSMLAADGNTLWTVPGGDPLRNYFPGPEHCDSVLIERFGPGEDAPLRIAMAASDLGFLLLDVDGGLLARHKVGHAQSLGAGRFRPDLPGRQFVVRTFWGNEGIMNLFDCQGGLLLTREMPAGGTVPVNWLGDGSALLRGAAALFDGNFEPVVKLPAGRRVRPIAFDVNDDGIDEVFVLEGQSLCIYGPESIPANPVRSPKRSLTNWNLYGGFYL